MPVVEGGSVVPNYTRQQLESLWVQAGGSKTSAPMAASIALAESGGNPNAINRNNPNGTIDRGLWQINSVHGGQSTLDPIANARAAVAISKGGTNWRPWCTAWSNGACGGTFLGPGSPVFRHMPTSPTVTGTEPTNAGTGTTAGNAVLTGVSIPGAPSWVNDALGTVAGWFGLDSGGWLQGIAKTLGYALMIPIGIGIMALGLILLVLSTRTVQNVGSAVGGAFVQGKFFGKGLASNAPAQTAPAVEAAPAPVSAEPVSVPAAPEPVAPAPAKKAPGYKPRHQQIVSPGGFFRDVPGKPRPRARLAVSGKDFTPLTPDEIARGHEVKKPTPGYIGRHNQ